MLFRSLHQTLHGHLRYFCYSPYNITRVSSETKDETTCHEKVSVALRRETVQQRAKSEEEAAQHVYSTFLVPDHRIRHILTNAATEVRVTAVDLDQIKRPLESINQACTIP